MPIVNLELMIVTLAVAILFAAHFRRSKQRRHSDDRAEQRASHALATQAEAIASRVDEIDSRTRARPIYTPVHPFPLRAPTKRPSSRTSA